MKRLFLCALAVASLSLFGAASAQDFQAAVVYNMGGKFDKAYNQSAFDGAERFKMETGLAYREFEVTSPTEREQAIRDMARRGATVVVGLGFAQVSAIATVAKEFPDVKFAIIDAVVDLPNVRSVVFKAHEGSFLVGMVAALASKTGKIGFVGALDMPHIRNYTAGYIEGAMYVNADIAVYQNITGTTPAAWNNPGKGSELALSQFGRGADVVYAVAGRTGIGVYQAAKDSGNMAIGVDSNQNYLHPGTMLTSMIKRVDLAVFNAFNDAKNNAWTSGVLVLGLAEDGVGYAIDEHNRSMISSGMEAQLEQARKDIISGKIVVQGYKGT